ncbi:MAG: protein kinase [Ktedonobacteraceae bacterium]
MAVTVKRGNALINAQALIGTMLGTCDIQKLLGQGSMGAVFLAQQLNPRRPVVVRVVSPATMQTPGQRTPFLERFQQEIKAISALEHAHIVPIYDYGEQNGLAYLVMPFIGGGTLRDILAQGEPLKLELIASYLDQMAAALDYAHERGIIHRDVRPANVLLNAEGPLMLSDFGLVKIAIERHSSQMRLLKSESPIGSLEYMAPEQVMGDVIDARTDLYSLGVILYQMVTGKTPFDGGTPIQIATQLVQASPPSPRQFRADLPVAAEQVILQALAKRCQDRFARTQDFANAFRASLTSAGILQESLPVQLSADKSAASSMAKIRRRSLFDPVWQQTPEEVSPATSNETTANSLPLTAAAPTAPSTAMPLSSTDSTQSNGSATPVGPSTKTAPLQPTRMRLGLKTSLLRSANETPRTHSAAQADIATAVTHTVQLAASEEQSKITTSILSMPGATPIPGAAAQTTIPTQISPRLFGNVTRALPAGNGEAGASGTFSMADSGVEATNTFAVPTSEAGTPNTFPMPDSKKSTTGALTVPNPESPFPATNTTGALMVPGNGQGTMKLTGVMKVVQVPVAGQPGRYVTGLLPLLPQTQLPPPLQGTPKAEVSKLKLSQRQKITALALVVALLCFIPGILLFVHTHPSQMDKGSLHGEVFAPDLSAMYTAQATATAQANYILTDPLTQNIHNWPIADSGYKVYMFEKGAYHVLDNDANQSAPAILPGVNLAGPVAYTLTMEEIRGNDSNVNNSFGMILRFASQTQGNQSSITFYSFEVVNTHGGEYQFWKYDNSKGKAAHPWTSIWHHAFGGEFHQGQGSKNANTFKVIANGKNYIFLVNGKKVGTAQDASFSSGEIGMLVNLKGTEVAFSDLRLTYN